MLCCTIKAWIFPVSYCGILKVTASFTIESGRPKESLLMLHITFGWSKMLPFQQLLLITYRWRQCGWVGKIAKLEIHRLRVQILFWPLADDVLNRPELNYSTTLVNSQLVCRLPPVGILNVDMFIRLEKPRWGLANYIYIFLFCIFILKQLPGCIQNNVDISHSRPWSKEI